MGNWWGTNRPMREKPPRRIAKLNGEEIRACYDLYKKGMSVATIADKIWEKYGFASARSAERQIYVMFHSYKFEISKSNSMRRLFTNCSRCNCPTDEYTPGCKACNRRHYARNYRAMKANKAA